MEVLDHARRDKNKPVREAAIEALNSVKSLEDPVVEYAHPS